MSGKGRWWSEGDGGNYGYHSGIVSQEALSGIHRSLAADHSHLYLRLKDRCGRGSPGAGYHLRSVGRGYSFRPGEVHIYCRSGYCLAPLRRRHLYLAFCYRQPLPQYAGEGNHRPSAVQAHLPHGDNCRQVPRQLSHCDLQCLFSHLWDMAGSLFEDRYLEYRLSRLRADHNRQLRCVAHHPRFCRHPRSKHRIINNDNLPGRLRH